MSRFVCSSLFLLLLLTTPAKSAFARMVIGVTPAVLPGIGQAAVVMELEAELSARTGETIAVRSFDSEAAELDWLIRFRELDAALVGPGLARTLPAGTLVHLTELPPATVVTHPGLAANRQETLTRAFRGLREDERGRRLLARLAGTAVMTAEPKAPAAAQQPAQATPAQATPAPAKPPKPPAVLAQPTPPPAGTMAKPAAPPPAPPPAPVPVAAAPEARTAPPVPPAPAPPGTVLAPAPPAQPPAPPVPPAVEPARSKRTLLLIAALVILTGIGIKIAILMRHWRSKSGPAVVPAQPPSAERFDFRETAPPPVGAVTEPAASHEEEALPAPAHEIPPAPETAPAKRSAPRRKAPAESDPFPPAGEELVVERGRLGKVKVPALFKRCADLPEPVILRVRAGDNETCVHFAGGQICHALSRNWRSAEGSRQWSNLAYLMVREGMITETERDQAHELIERQPGLRFAAALQQLGMLDLEALRHILARQAKATIYALILFSSGEYRIETDHGVIPAEESIALQVDPLLREASHHQAEWLAIRKALPNLGTLLDFAPDGREKLEQVRLSVHQQLLLSQVDGQTSVGTLCCESTMLDYEACRFLYLMVKAGVLQVVPTA